MTASPLWPARVIEPRAFNENATMRVPVPVWNFNSSANDGRSMRQAESPPFPAPPPYATFLTFGSAVQVTIAGASRSHHAFVTIP